LCHLAIYPSQLGVVAVCSGSVGTVGSILIALEGHRCLAVVVVGKAKKIVGQQAVVGRAVVIEELDIRLYVFDGEGLPRSVAPVDAVESSTHTVAVSLGSATGKRQQKDEDGQQMSHSKCKDTKLIKN
jgi:hypothetical protein